MNDQIKTMTDDLKIKMMECNSRCIRKIANNCREGKLSPYMSMRTFDYLREDFDKYKDVLSYEDCKALAKDLVVIKDYLIEHNIW